MKKMVSFSGGKDSTAMLLKLLENGEKIDEIVFADTGFEYPELYEYIKRIEKHIGRKITILNSNHKLWDKWFYGKVTRGKYKGKQRGFPFIVNPCWYMRESKFKPLQKKQKEFDIVYVGIAYDEQKRIGKDQRIKYPLVDWKWTEQDCVNYLNKKGLLNPLYLNMSRLGCWHCPYQNKASLYTLWKIYPDLWNRLKKYEKDCPHGFRPNTKLEELEEEFKNRPPKRKTEFVCYQCSGVKKAFQTSQKSLMI